MVNIRLYDIFRKDLHLPDAKAHELVEAIDEAVKGGHEENLQGVATKEFVKDEIQVTKDFVKSKINRVELKVEQTKSELTKSIYLTNLIQVLVIIGSILGIISFMFWK